MLYALVRRVYFKYSSLINAPRHFRHKFVCFSEASMYLPVVPIMNKHRKSLNLLELPHPQQHHKASQKYLKSEFWSTIYK